MSEELKPCPFCGEHVELKKDGALNFVVCMGGSSCKDSGLVMFFSDAEREEAIAAWNSRAQPAAQAVPEGWKLVPVDISQRMVLAWMNQDMRELKSYGVDPNRKYTRMANNYRAMLAAAPAQPAVQDDDWLTLAHEMEALGNRYWKAAVRERGHGAVQWLRNEETGCMFVFTRGEYADQLQEFCASLPLAQVKRAQPAAPPAQPEVQRLRAAQTAGEVQS